MMKRVTSSGFHITILCLYIMLGPDLLWANSRVFVTSEPSGASVTLDGNAIGKTPLVMSGVAPSHYKLEFRLTGYQRASYTLNVADDGLDHPVHVELAPIPKTGSIRITSQPTGGSVWIDDKKISGRTPLTVSDVSPGNHQVRLEKSGYRSLTQTASVVVGEEATLSPKLQALQGRLLLDSQPTSAQVKLDGTSIGRTSLRKTLSPGSYELELSLKGHETTRRSVTIRDGRDTTLTIPLKPVPQPPTPDNFGKLRFRTEPEQQLWNECSRLLTNCIIYYNAAILSSLLEHKEKNSMDAIIQSLL